MWQWRQYEIPVFAHVSHGHDETWRLHRDAFYESDEALNETYVGYAGATDLSTQGSYVRIDGPRVWIEATVQGGVVYKNVVH